MVRSPSALGELGFCAKVMFHAVYWSVFVALSHAGSAGAAASFLPFEKPFAELDAADQRMFRAVQEGLREAERVRGTSGAWPAPADLASRDVAPFAPDPIDRAGYTWRLSTARGVVNYVGTPSADAKRPVLIAVVTEPDPGTAPDPQVVEDEIHHRLADGRMVHVAIWQGPRLDDARLPLAAPNPDEGFRQVLIGPVRR